MADHSEELRNVVSAWDRLRPGCYDKDIVETWLIQRMKPAVEQARAALAERGDSVAIAVERERCAQIADAIDSGRGNEKEIARAIRRTDQ